MEKFPRPWIVGPYGCVWVKEDLQWVNGKWDANCKEPRLVLSFTLDTQELADLIVTAVNKYDVW